MPQEAPAPESQRPAEGTGDIELAYASLALFADDGTLDDKELDTLIQIAMRDGVLSDSEKEILRGVFNRILEPDVPAETWTHIQQIRRQHGI